MAPYKMGNLRIVDLRCIVKEQGLRGYSKLNKKDLIDFLMRNDNEINKVSSNVKPEPQTIEEVGQPLTHRQLKRRRMKNRRKEKSSIESPQN